jgi:hypothetical protein
MEETKKKLNDQTMAAIIIIPVLIIFIPLIFSLYSFLFAKNDQGSELFLEKPDLKYKNCVKETEYMRHHHWELLRAVREDVVRYGKRGEISLIKCKECHVSRERFCKKCHDAVSMKPDCYGCHYYP